jgi:hypothetical protein
MAHTTDAGVQSDCSEDWRLLYRLGAIAALIAVVFFRRHLSTELVTASEFGLLNVPAHPVTVLGWFTLLQENALLGLVLLDIVDVINYLLVGVLFVALYAALQRANRSAALLAMASSLVGIGLSFSVNQAFAMLNLSNRYAEATTDAQRAATLAAGEALLAINNPAIIYQSTGFYLGLLLVVLAGLIFSLVMLRSRVFNRATAWVGIAANGIALSSFLVLPLAPDLYAIPFVLWAPFRVAWYVMIALRLLRLTKGPPRTRDELATA